MIYHTGTTEQLMLQKAWNDGDYGKHHKEGDIAFFVSPPAILPLLKVKVVNADKLVGITLNGIFVLADSLNLFWDIDMACEALKQATQRLMMNMAEKKEWDRLTGNEEKNEQI